MESSKVIEEIKGVVVGGGGGGGSFAHRELPILVQLQCHPFLHLLSRNCFLLFVALKINFDTFRHRL